MSPETQRRLTFFGLALLLHGTIFGLLFRSVVFPAPPSQVEDIPFQIVKIAPIIKPPVEPPPPVQPPSVQVPNFKPAGGATASLPANITPSVIKMPDITPSINDGTAAEALNRLPATKPDTNTPSQGTGTGSDNAGNSIQNASSGTGLDDNGGNGIRVGDMEIAANEKAAIIVDISSSMHHIGYLKSILTEKEQHFKNAQTLFSRGARGVSYPGDAETVDPQQDGYGIYHVNPDASVPDLYAGVYYAIDQHMTTAIIITDFEDGDDPGSTKTVIDAMRAAHIRLYIVSTEKRPYGSLIEYALESGGEVILTNKDYDPNHPDATTTKVLRKAPKL